METSASLVEWLKVRELPAGRTAENFREAVTAQVVKDFQWDAKRVAKVSISLVQLLEDEINWGLDRDAQGLFASFYRLDLGESKIRGVMDWNERPKAARLLAELSLERAARKVWLRWTFGAVDSSS